MILFYLMLAAPGYCNSRRTGNLWIILRIVLIGWILLLSQLLQLLGEDTHTFFFMLNKVKVNVCVNMKYSYSLSIAKVRFMH